MSVSVRFEYKGAVRGVVLFSGMQFDELNSILKSAFSINAASIVGFLGEDDMIIPLTLACRSPEILTKKVYSLVVSGEDSMNNSLNNSLTIEDLSKDDNKDIEIATGEIFRFISGLKAKSIINEDQAKLLENNLDDSNLLFAAYSVAVSANDARYLANICKDIAQSLESESGQLACEAQDEVLQICDQLYLNKRITENQLLYLRHLVLIREEAVADIYDDFQDKKIDITGMAKMLYELANVHPKDNVFNFNAAHVKHINSGSAAAGGGGGNGSGSVSGQRLLTQGESRSTAVSAGIASGAHRTLSQTQLLNKKQQQVEANNQLSAVVVNMIDSNILSTSEAEVLIEMVKDKNEYVMAAFELFLDDQNKAELTDTLLRCVRLEVKKRGFMKKMDEMSSSQYNAVSAASASAGSKSSTAAAQGKKTIQEEDDDDEDDDDDDDDDEDEDANDYLDDLMMRQGYDYVMNIDTKDEEDEEKENDKEQDEKIDAEMIMSALGIENIWHDTVPSIFISLVFKAAYRQQMTLSQARLACDLYVARQEHVRATWGVYTLQTDDVDFIDSINRITRHYLSSNSLAHKSDSLTTATTAKPTKQSTATATAAGTMSVGSRKAAENKLLEEKQTQLRNQQDRLQSELQYNESEKQRVIQNREDAMKAIKDAKRELLKHSLDLMVSTDLIQPDEAEKIYKMTEQPYSLVDSVIDTYASNKDVSEFMKSLKLLATFVSGELDHLLGKSEEELKEMKTGGQLTATANTGSSVNPPKPPTQPPTKTSNKAAASAVPPPPPASTVTKRNTAAAEERESLLRREQAELTQIIRELNKAKVLTDEGTKYLVDLVQSEDRALIACYEKLLSQRNFDGFIEELIERVDNKPTASKRNAAPSGSSSTAGESSLLSGGNQKAVIEILAKANALTAEEVSKVVKLIDVSDPAVSRTFAHYERVKDLNKLITDLKALQIPIYKLSDQQGTEKFLRPQRGAEKRSDSPATYAATMASSDTPPQQYEDDEDEFIPEALDEDDEDDDDEDEEDEEDEDEDDDDDDEDDDDEEDAVNGYVEQKFLEIIQDMQLSPLDTSALRLAISRDDNLIKNALESYRLSLDEEALIESLYQVIGKTIQDIKKSDKEIFVPDEDSESEQVDSPRSRKLNSPRTHDEHLGRPPVFDTSHIVTKPVIPSPSSRSTEGRSSSSSAFPTATANNTANAKYGRQKADDLEMYEQDYELEDDDEDEDDDDDDDEEEEEEEDDEDGDDDDDDDDDEEEDDEDDEEPRSSGMVTSQTVRNHIFPILVNELVKEGILTTADSKKIQTLFAQGSVDINAALDIYDVDHDMGDLVDSLQSIAITTTA